MKSFVINAASAVGLALTVLLIGYLTLEHEANVRWRARCEMAAFNGEKLTGLAYRQCVNIRRSGA